MTELSIRLPVVTICRSATVIEPKSGAKRIAKPHFDPLYLAGDARLLRDSAGEIKRGRSRLHRVTGDSCPEVALRVARGTANQIV